jgi:hypothetical protein
MDYGQFLEKILDGILISYKEYGSYQGDYIAIIEKDSDWLIFKGNYGSCGGCDFLQGERIYSDEDYAKLEEADYGEEQNKLKETFQILPKIKEEYLETNKPFLILPKSQLPDTLEDFIALLPANTRVEFDEDAEYASKDDISYASVFEQMQSFKVDNLVYLEKKHKWEEAKRGKGGR